MDARTTTDPAPTDGGTSGSGTTSPRVAARRAATRAQILDAAWQLAHEVGLTGFSLRELAERVGMRAPSLYEYYSGKDAIYDAMFAQGNREFLDAMAAVPSGDEPGRRELLIAGATAFLEFAAADPVRFQLLFQQAIGGWEPSPDAYEPAQQAYAHMRDRLREIGATDQRSLDLWTAITSGLAHQQLANDPGGRRWHDLVGDAVDLFLYHLDAEGA